MSQFHDRVAADAPGPGGHVAELADDFVHRLLDAGRAAEVERHCAGCPACKAAVDDARRRLDALRAEPPIEASEELVRKTVGAIDAHRKARRRRFRRFSWPAPAGCWPRPWPFWFGCTSRITTSPPLPTTSSSSASASCWPRRTAPCASSSATPRRWRRSPASPVTVQPRRPRRQEGGRPRLLHHRRPRRRRAALHAARLGRPGLRTGRRGPDGRRDGKDDATREPQAVVQGDAQQRQAGLPARPDDPHPRPRPAPARPAPRRRPGRDLLRRRSQGQRRLQAGGAKRAGTASPPPTARSTRRSWKGRTPSSARSATWRAGFRWT